MMEAAALFAAAAGFAALFAAAAGFAAIALSMQKHHRDMFGAPASRGRAILLRVMGWTLLASSIAPCIAGSDRSAGLVLWFGLLTVAALVVALSLTCLPRIQRACGLFPGTVGRDGR